MTSATDIITYIGIPLAVLGVLPILYTFVFSILTQRRIRHLLVHHGHRPHTTRNNQEGFVLRASPMTSLIEVEMPRYTIAPVERSEDRYWQVSKDGLNIVGIALGHTHVEGHAVERVESTLSMLEEGRVRGFLRGGSWRTFHWRRLVVGRKLYRIQYEDELREPPAEIEFADLVNFLMDWGAELDGTGWDKLRSGGLWTPAGTVLLRVCDNRSEDADGKSTESDHGDWVLRTSMPDDSDGILTLCVRWPSDKISGSERDVTSLPPGWGRLRKPAMLDMDLDGEEKGSVEDTTSTLSGAIASLTSTHKSFLTTNSLRFTLICNQITEVHTESHNKSTNHTLSLSHLLHPTHPTGPDWFTKASTSLLTLTKSPSSGTLYTSNPPTPQLKHTTTTPSIPCGVLVLLSILPTTAAPAWETITSTSDDRTLSSQHHARFMARLRAEKLEAAMPPEQARVHKLNREAEDRRAQLDDMQRHLAGKRAREERRVQDALVSSRMGVKAVGELCLAWLVERGVVSQGTTMLDLVEGVLYFVAVMVATMEKDETKEEGEDERGSIPLLRVLEEWTCWMAAGGMKRQQLELLDTFKVEFCYAACIVAVVHEADMVSTGQGKASLDMLECLKLWRKVRLG